jgi:hypothetical protein
VTDESTEPLSPIAALQFGSDQDALAGANQLIDQRLYQHKEAAEIARGNAVVERIRKEHPEFQDNEAMAAAAVMTFDLLREDLTKLGVDFAEWERQLGRPVTNNDVAKRHLFHRASGHPVKSADQFLGETVSKYQAWKRGEQNRAHGLEDMNGDTPQRVIRSATVRDRINGTRQLRREATLSDDYGATPVERSAEDTAEIARRSSAVQAMQQARRAARNVSIRDAIGGRKAS